MIHREKGIVKADFISSLPCSPPYFMHTIRWSLYSGNCAGREKKVDSSEYTGHSYHLVL